MSVENYIQAWVKSGEVFGGRRRLPAPPITCKDGFSFSVQASAFHYSEPRSDDAHAYTHFEVGYPSQHEESLAPYLAPYAGEPDTPQTVFGWVPLRVIAYLINKHGGIDIEWMEWVRKQEA